MSAPTREQIVQAVRDKFAKDGFSSVSVAYCASVMKNSKLFSDSEILSECKPKKPELETVAPLNEEKQMPAVAPSITETSEPPTAENALEPEPGVTEEELIECIQEWHQDILSGEEKPTTPKKMLAALKSMIEARPPESAISDERLAEIVKTHAPSALEKNEPKKLSLVPEETRAATPKIEKLTAVPPYPQELVPLIESGVAYHEHDHWFVKRCDGCGNFRTQCCGKIGSQSAVRHGEKTLTSFGRQAVGLDPIKPPKSEEQIAAETKERLKDAPWMNQFRGMGELEGNGAVKMFIEDFIPEGITLLCGLMKEGKSFLAMSVVKALTTGEPLFGNPRFSVPESVPVLYLAAEGKDGGLKLRGMKFHITEDKTKFVARTLTQGPMLGLDDENIVSLVRTMRPVIILETLIRFNEGADEDKASENQKLAQALFHLLSLGAQAVIAIHHSVKRYDKPKPTKQDAARGSGDILAMADVIWLVMQDERLYQSGKGPNEVDVVGWGRDFSPYPMRLALTEKAPDDLPAGTVTFAPGIVSCIDTTGDLKWVDKQAALKAEAAVNKSQADTLEVLVKADPAMTLEKLAEATGTTVWAVTSDLRERGWSKPSGRPRKDKPNLWRKDVSDDSFGANRLG